MRAILHEATYTAAASKNHQLVGKKISKQAFAIIPKIREVDELLSTSERARRSIREIHPEVCFWGLNDGSSMAYGKKSKEGFAERMNLLEAYLPGAQEFATQVLRDYPRKDVGRDDIADALAALTTAMAPAEALRTLPEESEWDSRGLPMEMVYRITGQASAL